MIHLTCIAPPPSIHLSINPSSPRTMCQCSQDNQRTMWPVYCPTIYTLASSFNWDRGLPRLLKFKYNYYYNNHKCNNQPPQYCCGYTYSPAPSLIRIPLPICRNMLCSAKEVLRCKFDDALQNHLMFRISFSYPLYPPRSFYQIRKMWHSGDLVSSLDGRTETHTIPTTAKSPIRLDYAADVCRCGALHS